MGSSFQGTCSVSDSISDCGTTLYKMRLVQSTGVLSDFLLFGPETTPVVRATRTQFSDAMASAPPQVIVVSGWLHIDGPGDYKKLERWPGFAEFLSTNYSLEKEWRPSRPDHWWSRQVWPDGYRVMFGRDRMHRGHPLGGEVEFWWARRDLNPQPSDYEFGRK